MNMSRKEVVVSNVSKEHDNPIAELVQVACRYDSEIILESNNRRINAKSIMGIPIWIRYALKKQPSCLIRQI